MARLFFLMLMPIVGTVAAGCSANTVTQEQRPGAPMQTEASLPAPPEAPAMISDSPRDRGIRRDLTFAIGRDADLQHREISFNVTNGDISVTGIVRTEEERRKINDLALNIDGVKSVANAVRVAE